MKFLNIRKGKLTVAALIATVLCTVVAALAGIFGTFGAGVETANATAVGSDMYDLGANGNITAYQLARLMGKIMGSKTAKSYNELKAYMDSDTDNARDSSEIDLCVSLGGVYWNVVYASETKGGDVIATLWLASSSVGSKWNNTKSPEGYSSAVYGTSFIRSGLVGSQYLKSDGSGLSDGTQSTTWSTFLKQYGNYIATPVETTYQAHQVDGGGFWGNGYLDSNPYSDMAGYGSWQEDKLWLPSLSEVANVSAYSIGNNSGIWSVSSKICANTTSSWLRTRHPYGGGNGYACAVSKEGTAIAYIGIELDSYAVRPALHLNLKKAASAVGLFVDKPTLSKTSTTYATNTEFTLTRDGTAMAVYAPHALSAGVATQTYIEFKTNNASAGTYSFVCKLNTGYSWSDGTVGDCILPFVIYPAEMSAIAWGVTCLVYTSPSPRDAHGSRMPSSA